MLEPIQSPYLIASLSGFTHLQALVSKAHLLFEQWLYRSHAFLIL